MVEVIEDGSIASRIPSAVRADYIEETWLAFFIWIQHFSTFSLLPNA
jgi:hypothetical protein